MLFRRCVETSEGKSGAGNCLPTVEKLNPAAPQTGHKVLPAGEPIEVVGEAGTHAQATPTPLTWAAGCQFLAYAATGLSEASFSTTAAGGVGGVGGREHAVSGVSSAGNGSGASTRLTQALRPVPFWEGQPLAESYVHAVVGSALAFADIYVQRREGMSSAERCVITALHFLARIVARVFAGMRARICVCGSVALAQRGNEVHRVVCDRCLHSLPCDHGVNRWMYWCAHVCGEKVWRSHGVRSFCVYAFRAYLWSLPLSNRREEADMLLAQVCDEKLIPTVLVCGELRGPPLSPELGFAASRSSSYPYVLILARVLGPYCAFAPNFNLFAACRWR